MSETEINRNPMRVQVWLHGLSQPIEVSAKATYQKGDMFCIVWISVIDERMVDKYPMTTIFRVRQTY